MSDERSKSWYPTVSSTDSHEAPSETLVEIRSVLGRGQVTDSYLERLRQLGVPDDEIDAMAAKSRRVDGPISGAGWRLRRERGRRRP